MKKKRKIYNKTLFLSEATHKFEGRIILDDIVFVNMTTNISPRCVLHGTFDIKPRGLLNAEHGCPRCAREASMEKRGDAYDTDSFIKKGVERFGDKFSYPDASFTCSMSNILVTCRLHGEFTTTPNNFLKSQYGCASCATLQGSVSKGHMYDTKSFIINAKRKHGDRYDYSKVVYTGSNDYVTVICRDHGEYRTKPNVHLNTATGCTRCGYETQSKPHKYTTEENEALCSMAHNNRYTYGLSVYEGGDKPISFTCPDHGIVTLPSASRHRHGALCPLCNMSRGETLIMDTLNSLSMNEGKDYVREKSFDDLRSDKGWPLRYDFHVPLYNLLIEYDGRQHYEKVNFDGNLTESQMEDILIRNQHTDALKTSYADRSGIRLLRIPYWDKDKIPDMIEDVIKECDVAKKINM